jgi:hypothetical protein
MQADDAGSSATRLGLQPGRLLQLQARVGRAAELPEPHVLAAVLLYRLHAAPKASG